MAHYERPEDRLQKGVASWLRAAIIAPARFWFVPNGGGLTKAQAGIFKTMGLTSGVHDLHFIWRAEGQHDLLSPRFGTIEMKAGKNTLEPAQAQFGSDMEALGHVWAEARSLDEVLAILAGWYVPLREPKEVVKFAFRHGLKLPMFPSERF